MESMFPFVINQATSAKLSLGFKRRRRREEQLAPNQCVCPAATTFTSRGDYSSCVRRIFSLKNQDKQNKGCYEIQTCCWREVIIEGVRTRNETRQTAPKTSGGENQFSWTCWLHVNKVLVWRNWSPTNLPQSSNLHHADRGCSAQYQSENQIPLVCSFSQYNFRLGDKKHE